MASNINIFHKKVEVLSISPAVELKTGNNLLMVAFGEYIELTEVIKKNANLPQGVPIPKQIGVNSLLIYIPILNKKDSIFPYKVGSTWTLKVDSNGNITLESEN
ncbi:MAG: hypothetical protein M1124_00980 [Candidatus Marsarchaeota archaeon]|nr:hypothetical protein [Candidatus Marsarchaeota archaeon]